MKLLRAAVRNARGTVWGREHGYGELYCFPNLIEEYQRRVPLSHYSDLQPYIDRVVDGKSDVLWPGTPKAFAVSGGTCSAGHFVPISQEMMARLTRSSLLPGLCYLTRSSGASAILKGKILSLPGGIEDSTVGGTTLTGEVSGILAHRSPPVFARWLQAIPRHVMLMEDWEAKLIESARIAIRKDVRALIMVPSWAPVFFECVREAVGATSGAEAVRTAWPNLKVFFSGGVSLSTYRTILECYLGPSVDLIESYSASEGLFAFQDGDQKDGLILNLSGGAFYEFVPVEERLERRSRYTVETVKSGVDYVLYITNLSGMWSLCVEDVVRFVSTRPHRLRIVGRVGEVLDLFGDATRTEHVRRVIAAVNEVSGTMCLSYHLTYNDLQDSPTPRHHWVLELDSKPADVESYARSLDEFMKMYNGRYRTRREPGAMAGPIVTIVPPGSCTSYLRNTRKRLTGQSKIVNVSEDHSIARQIIAVAREIGGIGVVETRVG